MADTTTSSHHYVVILCGGTGPRLWPLSRASNPKQFLSLLGPESLLQQTLVRANQLVSADHIYLVSNDRYIPQIKHQTKGLLPPQNILTEPEKKNTLQAIVYATAVIAQSDPYAVITSMPSDHFITPIKKLIHDIHKSAQLANTTNSFVLIGINPTSPNPSYGYLETHQASSPFLNITKFVEKPDVKNALKLMTRGAFWNSGIYTFSVPTFVTELKKLQPEYARLYDKMSQNTQDKNMIAKMYHLAPNLAIDTAIAEKSKNLIAITASFKWSDVGEWRAIFSQLKKDKNNIASLDPNSHFISYDSQNCLIKTNPDKLIGLVGVKNLAIIDTPDGLLICDLESASHVRDLISQMVNDKLTQQYFLA